MDFFSPHWLYSKIEGFKEDSLHRCEILITRSRGNTYGFLLFSLLLWVGLGWHINHMSLLFKELPFDFINHLESFYWVVPITGISFSVIHLFYPTKHKFPWVPLAAVGVTFLAIMEDSDILIWGGYFFLPIILFTLFFRCKTRFFYGLFPLTVVIACGFLERMSMGHQLLVPFMPLFSIMPLSVIYEKHWLSKNKSSLNSPWHEYLNPGSLILPLPGIESSSDHLKNHLQGGFHLVLAAILCSALPYSLSLANISDFFLYKATFQFLIFSQCSYIFVLSAVGLIRLSGLSIPDPFRSPLIAANPIEAWSRAAVPLFQWFKSFVFAPLYKKTNSIFIAVVLTFMASFTLHKGHLFFLRIDSIPIDDLISTGSKYLLNGLLVYLFFKTKPLWPSSKTSWGWIGVVATQLLLSLCYYNYF